MNLFRMVGAWSGPVALVYERMIASGLGPLYDTLVEFLAWGAPDGLRILDVGCGAGHVARRLARRDPEARVTAVDLSPQQVARARRGGRDLANLSCRVADALNLDFDDGTFDVTLSVASIKHWPDPPRGVREMARVTKGGGRVWLVEANPDCTRAEAAEFVSRWRGVLPGTRPLVRAYFRRFVAAQGVGRETLAGVLTAAGLREVWVRGIPGQPLLIGTGRKAPAHDGGR